MKKILYKFLTVVLFLSAIVLISCTEEPAPSLYDIPSANLPTPSITGLNPGSQGLAGVTVITITGSNFSPDIKNDFVFFNGSPGKVLTATSTQLTVLAANVVSDAVKVKVSVLGAQNFSNIYNFKLLASWEEYYPLDKVAQKANGIIMDNNDNLLVNFFDNGIWKITPLIPRNLSTYIPRGNTQKWDNFRFGPGGELYGTRYARGLWKLAEGVAPASPWVSPPSGSMVALEFDNNQNLWVLNTPNTIDKVLQDKTITAYTFTGVLRAIRIFNNDLYVAATKDNIEGVWKIPLISNGDLGTPELYFDITNIKLGAKINALAFAADGDMIVGTDKGPNPILVVKQDKSYSELYPGVIPANSVVSIFWPSTGTSLYFARGEEVTVDATGKATIVRSQTVLRVEMEKSGAPYFGQ